MRGRKNKRHSKRKRLGFFRSQEWKVLRYKVLLRDNSTCLCCGRSAKDGYVMNVDHIMPIKKFPKLIREISNLQTLCSNCNAGKSNWDMTDHRSSNGMPDLDEEYKLIMKDDTCL